MEKSGEYKKADFSDAWAQQLWEMLWDFIIRDKHLWHLIYLFLVRLWLSFEDDSYFNITKHIQSGWDLSTSGQWMIMKQNLGDWCYGSYFDDTHKHGHKQTGGAIHFSTRFADAPNSRCKCHPVWLWWFLWVEKWMKRCIWKLKISSFML